MEISSSSIRAVLRSVLCAAAVVGLIGCAASTVIRTEPPPLPVYEQPFCPGPGAIWIPGYWAYGSSGYYWVPGMWEYAPQVGFLWTPGYWGWYDGAYVWHRGYWGRHIGYYGGINYGYGYTGAGYAGGYWRENVFYYNTAVTRVNVTVVGNVYKKEVVSAGASASTVSYNGGKGGTTAQPTREELLAAKERHINATPNQKQHVKALAKQQVKKVKVKVRKQPPKEVSG